MAKKATVSLQSFSFLQLQTNKTCLWLSQVNHVTQSTMLYTLPVLLASPKNINKNMVSWS